MNTTPELTVPACPTCGPTPELTVPACPTCGSTTWGNTEYVNETLALSITADPAGNAKLERQGIRFNADYEGWVCENGHNAPDDWEESEDPGQDTISNQLDDIRGTL